MPRYLIEREFPDAAKLTRPEWQALARRINQVAADMRGRAQWLQSYVSDDAITCVYIADSPEAVREHAALGGLPITRIRQISRVVDPASAE